MAFSQTDTSIQHSNHLVNGEVQPVFTGHENSVKNQVPDLCDLLKHAKKKAERIRWIVLITTGTGCGIEVYFDHDLLDPELPANTTAKSFICEQLGLTGNDSSVQVFKVMGSDFVQFAAQTQPGEKLQSSCQIQVATGAFCTVKDKPHIITVSHGKLNIGDHVTSCDRPPSFCGTVRACIHRLVKEACDAALVSLEGYNREQQISNSLHTSYGSHLQLKLYDLSLEHLEGKDCMLYETSMNNKVGTVCDVHFDYKCDKKLKWLGDCIAIVDKNGTNKSFIEEGDCGKVVIMKNISCGKAQGFGLIFGSVTLYVQTADHIQDPPMQKIFAVASPLRRTIDLLNAHEYCSGHLNLM